MVQIFNCLRTGPIGQDAMGIDMNRLLGFQLCYEKSLVIVHKYQA